MTIWQACNIQVTESEADNFDISDFDFWSYNEQANMYYFFDFSKSEIDSEYFTYWIGYTSEIGRYFEDVFVPFKYLKPYFDISLNVDLDRDNTYLKYLDVNINGVCNCKDCPDKKPSLYTMSDIFCKEKISVLNLTTHTGKYPTNQDMFLDMAVLLVKCPDIEATIEYRCQVDDKVIAKFLIKNKNIKLLK